LSIDFLENQRDRAFSDDFDAVLDTLLDEEATGDTSSSAATHESKSNARSHSPHSCGPFLDAIINYMETHKIPFQHADLWVPSYSPQEGQQPASQTVNTDQLRLYHAGHASRGDLDDALAYKLREFGVYSDNFSFEPGHGLPGRVYVTGEICWENAIQDTDPKIFERAGGAKVYGLKTAVGIPLNTAVVGRIVVTMYSCADVSENMSLARDIAAELAKYAPEPKWQLTIDTSLPQSPSGVATPLQYGKSDFLDNQDNLTLSPMFEPSETPQWEMAKPSTSSESAVGTRNEEQQLVSLLGQYMPMNYDSSSESGNQLQLFMSIRLLLLRPSMRRSSQENEMLEILKNSYRAYAKDSRRDGKELARLLVKDWECLQKTYSFQPSTAPLPSPTMQKPLQPPPSRRLSLPVERRLSSVPLQRRVSATSLPQSFLPSPTLTFASHALQNPPQGSLASQAFTQSSQFGNAPQQNHSQLTPQLNHTHYMPKPPLNLRQIPSSQCLANSSVAFMGPSNSKLHSGSPAFQPQTVISELPQDQSMAPITPVSQSQ
jgi:hypothetical protein